MGSDLIEQRHDIREIDPAISVQVKRTNRFICPDPRHMVEVQDHISEIQPAIAVEVLVDTVAIRVGGRDIPLRRTLSLILNRIFAAALGLPYKDISTGYRIYRKPFIDSLSFKTLHYDIQEETVFRVHRAGGRILEIPLQFRPRAGGDSKASVVKQGIHFARTLLRLWNERVRGNVRIHKESSRKQDENRGTPASLRQET
jgi:hypothetical protein